LLETLLVLALAAWQVPPFGQGLGAHSLWTGRAQSSMRTLVSPNLVDKYWVDHYFKGSLFSEYQGTG